MALSERQREWLHKSRERQGLPPKVEDPAGLDKVMTILRRARDRAIEREADNAPTE